MKIDMNDSIGFQTFNVPNTPEGKTFLDLCRKYLNRNEKHGRIVTPRGRGPRPSRRYQSHIPQSMAKWFAVYLPPNEANRQKERERQTVQLDRYLVQNRELLEVKAENNRRAIEHGKIVSDYCLAKEEIANLRKENERLKQEWSGKSIPAPIAVAMPSSHGRQVVVRITVE